jgi:toxin YoeB
VIFKRVPEGIGKPEPLQHGLSGYWSRRITDEHRIVYKIDANSICIVITTKAQQRQETNRP